MLSTGPLSARYVRIYYGWALMSCSCLVLRCSSLIALPTWVASRGSSIPLTMALMEYGRTPGSGAGCDHSRRTLGPTPPYSSGWRKAGHVLGQSVACRMVVPLFVSGTRRRIVPHSMCRTPGATWRDPWRARTPRCWALGGLPSGMRPSHTTQLLPSPLLKLVLAWMDACVCVLQRLGHIYCWHQGAPTVDAASCLEKRCYF